MARAWLKRFARMDRKVKSEGPWQIRKHWGGFQLYYLSQRTWLDGEAERKEMGVGHRVQAKRSIGWECERWQMPRGLEFGAESAEVKRGSSLGSCWLRVCLLRMFLTWHVDYSLMGRLFPYLFLQSSVPSSLPPYLPPSISFPFLPFLFFPSLSFPFFPLPFLPEAAPESLGLRVQADCPTPTMGWWNRASPGIGSPGSTAYSLCVLRESNKLCCLDDLIYRMGMTVLACSPSQGYCEDKTK